MNKYQEALNELSYPLEDSSCGGCKCGESDCSCEKRIAVETLQELVDKATPKKPIKDEPSRIRYIPTYVCPSCGQRFSGMISNFCYHCGQKLDWSDEK